jgi:hypothetical protein
MHSLNLSAYAHAVADEHVAAAARRAKAGRPEHPPPVRRWAAFVAARVARRLDAATARRAVV